MAGFWSSRPRAGRIVEVKPSNERQVREVLDNSGFFSREHPKDLPMFLEHGGKVLHYTGNDKTAAILAYIHLPNLLKLKEQRNLLDKDSPLHILTGNPALFEKVARDYRNVPPEHIVYAHGINPPDEHSGGMSKVKAAANRLFGLYTDLLSRSGKSLLFGLVEASPSLNVPSLRMALRNGYVIDDHAEVNIPSEREGAQKNVVLRLVRPAVPLKTGGAAKAVHLGGNLEFFETAKKLLSQGFVGVGYDRKTGNVIFKKKAAQK